MNIIPVIVYSLSSVLMALLIYVIGKHNWCSSTLKFSIKKILDCMVAILIYIYIVTTHDLVSSYDILETNKYSFIIMGLMYVVSFIATSIPQFIYFYKNRILYLAIDKTSYIFSVFSVFFIMLIGFSSLNYIFHIVFPNSYSIPENLETNEKAFEFIYYTFNLMLTYDSNTIIANSILTKIVQMIEMMAFYIFVGVILSSIIGSIPKNNKDSLTETIREVLETNEGEFKTNDDQL